MCVFLFYLFVVVVFVCCYFFVFLFLFVFMFIFLCFGGVRVAHLFFLCVVLLCVFTFRVPHCDVRYEFRIKRCSVRLCLQLLVGGRMSYLRYQCLLVCPTHIVVCCCFMMVMSNTYCVVLLY